MTPPLPIYNLFLHQYTISYVAIGNAYFPTYDGAWLRGVFGEAFELAQITPKVKANLRQKLMENETPKSHPLYGEYKDAPRAYLFEPLAHKMKLNKGDIFPFNFILIGKSNNYIGPLVKVFEAMGNIGFGRPKCKFSLIKVSEINPFKVERIIWNQGRKTTLKPSNPISLDLFENIQFKKQQIQLNFETFTKLDKVGDKLLSDHPFYNLIKSLGQRTMILSNLYCGSNYELMDIFYSDAKHIKIQQVNLKWVKYIHLQTREQNRLPIDGYIGNIIYEGRFNRFVPLLLLGQYLHVGKNLVYGAGKYNISHEYSRPV